MKKLALLALAAGAPAMAAVLYDNGPLATGAITTAGVAAPVGTVWSELATTSNTIFGFGNQQTAGNRMADDFTIPAGETWRIDAICFYNYQTGSGTASTITGITLRVWDAAHTGGTLLHGDTTTNTLASTAFSGIYRATSAGGTTRPIMKSDATVGGLVLGPGTYWVDWAVSGTLASGPWQPPVTILGLPGKPGGNATQSIAGGAFVAVSDASVGQDMPFTIKGEIIPAPASLALLGLGGLVATRRRR